MQIAEQVSLRTRTTIRLGGTAYQELTLEAYRDENTLLQHIEKEGLPVRILGGGSNIIASDVHMDTILLRTNYGEYIDVLHETDTHITFTAPASMPLQKFVAKAMIIGAEGFEGLAGVPGTLGGAIAMNAGSFGCESNTYLSKLTVLSLCDGIVELYPSDWSYSYRSFTLTQYTTPFLSITAEFTCPKKNTALLRSIFAQNMLTKKSRQPLQSFSAGCVFKNPIEGESTGKMLEAVGMKEIPSKHFAFSKEHANFLIHTSGNGTTAEALELIEEAVVRVHKVYNYTLEKEVKIWL